MTLPAIWSQLPPPLPYLPRRVCFVSGLSDPSSSALSRDQLGLLHSLPFEDSEILSRNFPFTSDGRPIAREVSVIWASLMNSWQYLRLGSPRYRFILQKHWGNLLQTTGHLYLISLSCGLELIRVGIESLPDTARIHVMALGPVCRRLPRCRLTIIQGEKDWISQGFVSGAHHRIPGLGHLGYTGHPMVREILCSSLVNSISE